MAYKDERKKYFGGNASGQYEGYSGARERLFADAGRKAREYDLTIKPKTAQEVQSEDEELQKRQYRLQALRKLQQERALQPQKERELKAYREYQQALIQQQFAPINPSGNAQAVDSDKDSLEQVPRLAYKNAGFQGPRMARPVRSRQMTPDEVFGQLYETTTTRQESAPRASDGDHSKNFQRRMETYVQAQQEGRSQRELDSYLTTLVEAGDITREEAEEIRDYRTQYEEVASYSPRELEDNEETRMLRSSLMSGGVLMGLNDSQREYLSGEEETRRQQLQEQREALEETLRELESGYDDDSEMDRETPEAERVRQVRAELDRVNQELWQAKSNIGSIQMAQNLAQRQETISAYEAYRENPDFSAVSQQARNGSYSRNEDPLGYYIANQEEEEIQRAIGGLPDNPWSRLNDDEKQMYYYLLGSKGTDAAKQYLDDIQIVLDKRIYDTSQERTTEIYQNSSTAGKVGLNALTVPTSVFGGVTAAAGDLIGVLTGEGYNPYNQGHALMDYTQTVRGATAEDIQGTVDGTKQLEQQRRDLMKQWVNMSVSGRATTLEQRTVLSQLAQVDDALEAASGGNRGISWGQAAANTYQAVMSGADSALGATLFGKGYTVVMGSGAASQRARELWEAGASDVQIGLGAVASGLIEMATEKYSVEYFTENFLHGSIQGPKDWLVKTLIQGFNEGSEEVASELANMVADAMILGANSDNQQEIRELMESDGLSYEEAQKQAYLNRVLDVFWAAYGGFVSGGTMGGIGGGVNYAQQNSQFRAYGNEVINNQAVQELMQRAQEIGVSPELYQLAQEKAAQDLEQMTGRQQRQAQKAIGKLYAETVQAQQESLQGTQREVFRQEAQDRLTGKTDDAQAAAEAVTKAAYGEELTQQERQTVEEAGGDALIEEIANSEEFQEAAQERFNEKARTVADTVGMAEDLTKQRGYVERFANNNGMDAEVMKSAITRGQNAIEFTNAWQNAYDMGAGGIALRYAQKAKATSYLTQQQIETAYNEGRKAGYYEETQAGEGAVPDGVQWNDRADSGGQIRSMEGFPGEEGQQWQAEAEAGAAGAAESVTAIDHNARLGNRNGNVKWLAPEQYSEDARQAEQEAKKNGLRFAPFRGGALTTTEEVNGRKVTVRSRGCVVDGTMYVRVDDNTFTARQIAGHEAAHERIRRGEINVEEAKQRLLERYSMEEIDAIIELYASAYGDSGLTAQEVLEEIICDAMGQMNAFATEETERVAGEVGVFLRNVRRAAVNDTKAKPEPVTKRSEPKQEGSTQKQKRSDQGRAQEEESAKAKPEGTFAFHYNSIAPVMSIFANDGKGKFTIYEDGTLAIRDDAMQGANTLEGWRSQGMMELYDIYLDGQKWTQGQDMPTGYYRIESVTKKPTVKKTPGGSYAIDQKGVMRLVDIATKNTTGEGGVKYSRETNAARYDYSKPFADQVEDYKNGVLPQNDTLLVGGTPDVFIKIGFNALPMTINKTHVDYALKNTRDADHFVGEANLKKLPEMVKKPVAVFVSQTQSATSVVALLPFETNRKQTVAPVLIDGVGVNNGIVIDSNAMTSLFGKTNAVTKLLYDAVRDEMTGKFSLLYWNKKEAMSLLQQQGLQLPGLLIPHDGFINSIRDPRSPVKPKMNNVTETQQFKRWFGDWQNYPQKASKVVNADGTPKIVYHQTDSDFTIFDTRHEGAGTRDSDTPFGIFMKSSDKDIGLKGGKQMAIYASIKNPLVVKNREELIAKLRNISQDYVQAYEDLRELNDAYSQKYEDAKKELRDYMTKWREEHTGSSRTALYDDERFNELYNAEDNVIDEWEEEARKVETISKDAITRDLEKKGYDGVIVRQDKGSFGRLTDTYIALKPEQVKSATDNIGTFDGSNPDIRYSREMQSMEELRRVNRALERKLETVQRQAAREIQKAKDAHGITRTPTANKDDVAAVARRLLMDYGSKSKQWFIREELQKIADAIIGDPEADFSELRDKARLIADNILQGATYDINWEQNETFTALQKELRKTYITVTPSMKTAMGDWEGFHQRHRYDMHFRDPGNGGTAIDTLWDDWADRYGSWLFPENIANPEDQLQHLEEVLESIAPQWANPYSVAWNQTVDTIANDIMDTLLSDAVRQKGPTDTDRAISRAREEAYQQGLEHANEEWEEFLSLRVQAETEQLRQKLEIREGKLEQRYQAREDAIRKEAEKRADAAIDRKEDYLQRTIERGRERERTRILRAQNSQIRQQIYNLAGKFETMSHNRGQAKTRHASPAMMNAVKEFLYLFNEDRTAGNARGAEALRRRQDELAKRIEAQGMTAENMEEAAKIARALDRNQAAREKLARLSEQYDKLGTDAIEYDETVAAALKDLTMLFNQKNILDSEAGYKGEAKLKEQQRNLQAILDTMRSLMHEITQANEAFSMGEGKRITDMAGKWAGEIRQVNHKAAGTMGLFNQYVMKQMSPDTFFSYLSGHIKGNEGTVIQQGFVAGDRRSMAVQREFDALFSELLDSKDKKTIREMAQIGDPKKKQYVDWGLKDSEGNAVLTSRGMMLQAYMLLVQDDSRKSLVYNGFRLPNSEIYYKGKFTESYGNISDAASVSQGLGEEYRALVEQRKELMDELDGLDQQTQQERRDQIFDALRELKERAAPIVANREAELMEMAKNIEDMMTGTERRLVELAHEWYSRSGQMMRDVFLQMYGYEPKLVENYTPIHRDPDSLQTDIRNPSEAQKALNLENMGSTKERVPSKKPILLTDILVELQQQKNQMARYVGFAQVQKDFNKIWKCQVGDTNIATLVGRRFGKGESTLGVSGQEYVNKYIADVAGGARSKNIFDSIYSNYAAATLRLNPRVAVSQAASIPTAAAVVGWKHAAVGFAKGLPKALNTEYRNQLAAKNEYFYYRYRGAGGAADMAGITRKGGMIEKAANSRVGKMLFNWCQAVDVFSTGSIMWEMAQSKVRSDGMKRTDPGYEDAVNQVYTDIIRKSQPNYSVTERSDLLRDKRGGMKLLTMFKTQSNQNLNILMNASMELNRMKQDLKNNRNGVTEEDVKKAVAKVGNAYSSVLIGGTVFFVALRTAMNFILHAVNPYRDDDTDEVTKEGIALGMLRELGSSIAGMAALGGQIYDFVIPTISGEKYYGISDSAIEALSNLLENSQKTLSKLIAGEKISDKQIKKTVESTCMVLGIPAGNARKIVDAIKSYAAEIQNGTLGKWESADTTDTQLRARIIKKVLDGDEQGAGDALALLIARSSEDTDEDTEKWILSNTKKQMHEAYKLADITDTEAIKVMKYLGEEAPDAVVEKWEFQLERPEVENPSDKLVATYNMRGSIDGDVLIEAYYYKNGHTKEETVAYIQAMKISSEDKKKLWDLIKGNWKDKGTPWE